jgi:DNA-binding NtrC family response regulator
VRLGKRKSAGDVPDLIRRLVQAGIAALPQGTLKEGLVDAVERELIEQVMRQCRSGVDAARAIGINRNTLAKKLEEYRGGAEEGEPRP